MTTVRIKDLSTATPTATGVVAAFDSAGGGTRKATIKELVRVGLEALGLGLSHAAAANPTVNDDSGDGYAVGSIWLNTSTGGLYVCTDPTLGAAVWTSAGGGAVTFAAVKAALAAADDTVSFNGQAVTDVDVCSVGELNADGWLVGGGGFALNGVLTPSQITADQTDYHPVTLETAFAVRLSSDASRTINSFADPVAAGETHALINVGSNFITLLSDDGATGTAARRFIGPGLGNYLLGPGESCLVRYDTTSSRWRIIAGTSLTLGGCLFADPLGPDMYAITALDMQGNYILALPMPTGGTHAATKAYVDQVAARTVSGTTDTTVADDIGGVVMYSQAGGVTVSLPSLASSLTAGRAMVLTFQATNAATVITVDPGTSVTIDGSTSNFVAPTGKARVSLISVDGLAWYSGTP